MRQGRESERAGLHHDPWSGPGQAWDDRLVRWLAVRRSPALDRILPAITRAADHSVLWAAIAGLCAATGRRRPIRAAARGLGSVAVSSLLVNVVAKRALPRDRPPQGDVPRERLARRIPTSGSFPSGHASSAAAFAVGASLELPALAVPVGATALAVGVSRVYTGVHYPTDVVVGAAVGAAVALLGARLVPVPSSTPAGSQVR